MLPLYVLSCYSAFEQIINDAVETDFILSEESVQA